jgi:hypothetical protein
VNQTELCKAVRELRLQAWRAHELSRKPASTKLMDASRVTELGHLLEGVREQLDRAFLVAHTSCKHDDE